VIESVDWYSTQHYCLEGSLHLIAMSGRGGRHQGSGRGLRGAYSGRGGRGQGNNYSGTSTGGTVKQKGECIALGEHVFDYGQKGSAHQLRTTWEKIVNYTGTTFGQDICNELQYRRSKSYHSLNTRKTSWTNINPR
jgi:hypothetical protein